MALSAVRSYGTRMPAHAGSYVLAAGAVLAVAPLAPRGLHDARALPVLAAGLGGAMFATFWAANYLAHRWALSAAAVRLARDADWTAEVVQLLERATADDRRGTRAVGAVVDHLTRDSALARLARFALRRVGADAVTRVAAVLADARAGDEPMAQQVQRRVVRELESERRGRLFALVGLVVLIAVVAAVFWSGLVKL